MPEPGSVPAFPVETDFQIPPGYQAPKNVDLSKWFTPPGNQGRQASCTTWAFCYAAMGYFWNRADERTYIPRDTADPTTTYSPAFLFNLLKQRSNGSCDDAESMEEVVRLASTHGICTWEQMPYDTALASCTTEVPIAAMRTARTSLRPQLVELEKTDILQWKYHLDMGHPIIAVIVPDSVFWYRGYATNGDSMLNWRSGNNGPLGHAHAVVCTGYCGDSLFTFINSYGTQWGGHGYFTATWKMLHDRCVDAHALVNDTIALVALAPMLYEMPDSVMGSLVKERFKIGQVRVINRTAIRLERTGKGHRNVLLQLFSPADRTLQHSFEMRSGQRYSIYANGQRTTYLYSRPKLVARALHLRPQLTVITTETINDPYLQERDAQLRRLRAAMP